MEDAMVTEGTREVVDLVAFDAEGNVILGLVQTEPWSQEAILALQEKVNVYLAYWDSGQLAADFPQAEWKPISIHLLTRDEPDADAEDFLEKLAPGLRSFNVGLTCQRLNTEKDS